jgi:hypothetical protein
MEPAGFRSADCPGGSPARSSIDVRSSGRQICHSSLVSGHSSAKVQASVDGDPNRLGVLWAGGYSIAELWGHSEPVTRDTSSVEAAHGLLWGILSIVEYQVSKGAGHRYLRERLWAGDWIAIGNLEPKGSQPELCRVPRIKDAKFGRKVSAIGDGTLKYTGVRIVHAQFDADPIV